MATPKTKLRSALLSAFNAANNKQGFNGAAFFDHWFRRNGKPLFFLFSKNLRVTNTQYAELLALLRANVTSTALDGKLDLQFLSVKEFNEAIHKIVTSFPQDQVYKTLVDLYGHLIRRIVVVDCYFGSCAVFVPPVLEVDLQSICAASGYIHSCGYSIFVRNAYKANVDDMRKAIRRHFKRHPSVTGKVFFAPYAHEDFSRFDRKNAVRLNHGLDEVKIHLEKFYMGSDRLVSVVKAIRDEFRDLLEVPEPWRFSEKTQRTSLEEKVSIEVEQCG